MSFGDSSGKPHSIVVNVAAGIITIVVSAMAIGLFETSTTVTRLEERLINMDKRLEIIEQYYIGAAFGYIK